MALHLVTDTERLTYAGDGFEIYYRRIPPSIAQRIIGQHTNKKSERTNWAAVADDMLTYAVLGWTNVLSGGEPVEYSPDLLSAIPGKIAAELVESASDNARDALGSELGN